MTGQVVANTDKVLVHFSVSLTDGTLVDDTRSQNKPVLLLMNSDLISDAMKQQIMGLEVGESKQFTLTAAEAFGEANPDLIQFFQISQFPADIELKVGAVVSFDQPNGEAVPGTIVELQADSVKVDFNHPLADKDVVFDLEVLDIPK